MVIDGKEELGFILNPKRSRRYSAEVIIDLDYADDIALICHEIAPKPSWIWSCKKLIILQCQKDQNDEV